jgi:hypothetical protein
MKAFRRWTRRGRPNARLRGLPFRCRQGLFSPYCQVPRQYLGGSCLGSASDNNKVLQLDGNQNEVASCLPVCAWPTNVGSSCSPLPDDIERGERNKFLSAVELSWRHPVMHTRQRDETENDRDMARMIETFRELSRLSRLSARFLGKPSATN